MNNHWSMDAVMYHIYSLSLAKASFVNNYETQSHKFSEIEKWLPHIKSVGCNAVLFSPKLKERTHGYDVTDYMTIDNRIGTNDEFRSLVKLFHENGIRIILDSVFHHCGRDFFAFQELQKGNRSYADWFCGVDFSRQSPMGDSFNYESWDGYYELVKFNLQNENVRNYLFGAARYWIETFDIDGMRLDAADKLNFDFMRKLRNVTTNMKSDFWLMGEVVHGDYSRWVNHDTLHSVTNYSLFKSLFSSHNDNNLFELAHNLEHAIPNRGLPLYTFLDNHDQPRIASNIQNKAFLNTLYALLFTVPGIPSIYYGSEWGIEGVKAADSDWPLRPYISIDNPPPDMNWLPDFIRTLIRIRRKQPALRYGAYRQIYLEYHKPFVFERFLDGNRIFVAINIGSTEEKINLQEHHHGDFSDLLSGEKINSKHVSIHPHWIRILKIE
jgi:glycosidase